MQFHRFSSFIKGLVANQEYRSKIGDSSLLNLHNMDVDIVGQIKRRNGYKIWDDLQNNNSSPSENGFPVTEGENARFDGKVQAIFPFTDLSGLKYIFIVTNSNIYLQEDKDDQLGWLFLNPTGRIVVNDKTNHIDVVPYLDTVFFNDYKNDVLMYDTSLYSSNQSLVVGSSYIYFAGDKIKYRSSIDFSEDAANTVTIESSTTNIEGNQIYNSLVAIGFTGPGGDVPSPANLKFGYSLAVGSSAADYTYFVLENQLNQRGDNLLNLVRFDSNINATAKLQFSISANAHVLSMGYYGGFLYLWCEDGVVRKISEDFTSTSNLGLDTAGASGIVNSAGDKEYHINANERGIFLYSDTVPTLNNWYQPIIIDDFNFTDATKDWIGDGGAYNFNTTDKEKTTSAFVFAKEGLTDINLSIDRNYYRKVTTGGSDVAGVHLFKRSTQGNVADFYLGQNILYGVDTNMSSTPIVYNTRVNYSDGGSSQSNFSRYPDKIFIDKNYVRPTGTGLNNSDYSTHFSVTAALQASEYNGQLVGSVATEAKSLQFNGGWSFLDKPKASNFIYNGIEYKSNFTYTKNLSRVNIFSFSDIIDNTSDTYKFNNFANDYSKYNKAGVISVYNSNVSNAITGTNQFFTTLLTPSFSNIQWEDAFSLVLNSGSNHVGNPPYNLTDLYLSPVPSQLNVLFPINHKFSSALPIGWYQYNGVSSSLSDSSSVRSINYGNGNPYITYSLFYYGSKELSFSETTGMTLYEYRQSALYSPVTKKISFHPNFVYDKERAIPAEFQLWDSNLLTNNSWQYLGDSSSYNSTVFSSMTSSNYVLLLGFNFQGEFLSNSYGTVNGTKNWRFMFVLGKKSHLNTLVPINYTDSKYLYFGNSLIASTAGRDNGYIYKLNMDSTNENLYLTFETRETNSAQLRDTISGDNKWYLIKDLASGDSADFRISDSWIWGGESGDGSTSASFRQVNYTDFIDFRSRLVYHINKNPVSTVSGADEDRLRYLGTPIAPLSTIDNSGFTGTLYTGDQYRYYVSFQFFSGEKTHLGPSSVIIQIPDLSGVGGTQADLEIIISSLNLLNAQGIPLYNTEQVEYIRLYRQQKNAGDAEYGEINFRAILEKDRTGNSTDFYYYDANGGVHVKNKAPTAGGTGYTSATAVSTSGGTGTGLTVDTIASAGAITSFSVRAPGSGYAVGNTITISGGGGNATYTLTHNDFSFGAGTYIDATRTLTNQPYTTDNLQTFPCEHILVHQNRLILVNDLKSGNTNTILYSEVDLAQAIDRGNFRDIESGDGDKLVRGVSMQEILYLFKERTIYAIIGDVADGQIIDVSRTIGCPYKNMVVEYNNRIYFLNRDGIYMISGREVIDIEQFRLDDFFNENLKASIDFQQIEENGVSFIDTKTQNIFWHLPLETVSTNYNTGVICFNVVTNTFKTYSYGDNIFVHRKIIDLNGNQKTLLANYSGQIFEESLDNSDNGVPIDYFMKTKAFNDVTSFIRRAYNLIKVHGDQLQGVNVTCEIDGTPVKGVISLKQKRNGSGEIIFTIPNRGDGNEIEIFIKGSDLASPPALIDEIVLGYSKLRGIR